MIQSALSQTNENLFIDFLTFQDIELLRAKKSNDPEKILKAKSLKAKQNLKRFLILTYQDNLNRYQYPLSLNVVAKPDPVSLRRIINRLKGKMVGGRTCQTEVMSQSAQSTKSN